MMRRSSSFVSTAIVVGSSLFSLADAATSPEQVHVTLGLDPEKQLNVEWSTLDESFVDATRPHYVVFGDSEDVVRDAGAPQASRDLLPKNTNALLDHSAVLHGRPGPFSWTTAESFLFSVERTDDMSTFTCLSWNFGPGCVARNHTMHVATMDFSPATGAPPSPLFYYKVGRDGEWSKTFTALRPGVFDREDHHGGFTYSVYGDMGDYNGQSRPILEKLIRNYVLAVTAGVVVTERAPQGSIAARNVSARSEGGQKSFPTPPSSLLLHLGDFAYNLESDDGRNGDAYMRDMENITSFLPYVVLPGNHERHHRSNHYVHRFQSAPSNDVEFMPKLPAYPYYVMDENGGEIAKARKNNYWYCSWQEIFLQSGVVFSPWSRDKKIPYRF